MEKNGSSYCEGKTLKQTGPCQYLSLTNLTLSHFPNLKHMRGLVKFPSLKDLKLLEMASLEELWTTTRGFEIQEEELSAQYCFPAVSNLSIRDCPKLSTMKPYIPPSLENLCLLETNLQLLSPGNFSHLLPPPANESSSSSTLHSAAPLFKQLQMHGVMGSSPGWELLQHHTYLETLCIRYCNDMTQVPESIRSLTSLQQLQIRDCSTLGALPEWLGELCSLRHLLVSWTRMIASLPQSIGHLTSLESLDLVYCGALAELPEGIGQLSALRRLIIQGCPALQCLPQSIQRLTALQDLVIIRCPALASRYKQGMGPDWHLISHIPDVCVEE